MSLNLFSYHFPLISQLFPPFSYVFLYIFPRFPLFFLVFLHVFPFALRVLHLHPEVHVGDLRLLLAQEPRPLARPALPQGHGQFAHRGRAPATQVRLDVVEEENGEEVSVPEPEV